MSVFQSLSVVALRQLVNGACNVVGISGGGDKVVEFLTTRFTDHSLKLTNALQTANGRSWKALEIALAGDSLWERWKVALAPAEDRAFREQVQAFLKESPLKNVKPEQRPILRQALQELRATRKRGTLTEGTLAPAQLARQAGAFAGFSDPQAIFDEEWKVVHQIAHELRETCPNLYRVLAAKIKPQLLAVAVRYYFRREVERDQELFQGLAFAKLGEIKEAQDKGFAELSEALSRQGEQLEQRLSELTGVIIAFGEKLDDTNKRVREMEQQIKQLLERLQLQNRELRPSDSLSIRNEGERLMVKRLVREYHSLSEEDRGKLPGLLNNLGKLEVAAGDFGEAQQKFQTVARMVTNPKDQAEAHYNAYQAALERRAWVGALASLRHAVSLDPARFAPFPMDRCEPQQILGAGGFGVVFRCKHPYLARPVVMKSLLTSELDRSINDVFAEARALEELDHPAIIQLRDCGFADAARSRPYLMMDYFAGQSLESYVAEQGLLSPEDMLAVALPVAEALQAAHARGILHRDVKPDNILVRRDGAGWRVKLIDFGLALRPALIEGQPSSQGSSAQTTIGKSIAGTVHYAAPEQMGQQPGVAVGRYSDVFGFGKTCYYGLLKTPNPDYEEQESLPDLWRKLLSQCTRNAATKRLQEFAAVRDGLTYIREQVEAERKRRAEEHGVAEELERQRLGKEERKRLEPEKAGEAHGIARDSPKPEQPPEMVEAAPPGSAPVLYCRNKGLVAQGYETEEGFVVQAGAQAVRDCSSSISEQIATLRATLLREGTLVPKGDHLKLTRDYTFSSSSSAACTLAGGVRSGPATWKDAQGRTLRELQAPSERTETAASQGDQMPRDAPPQSDEGPVAQAPHTPEKMDTKAKKSKRRLRLPQVRLLRALADGSQLSRGDLAKKAGFSAISGTVTVALTGRARPPQKGLVALGLVRRLDLHTSEDDKLPRETAYEITAKGRKGLEKAEKRLPPLRDKDASTNKRYFTASTQASQGGTVGGPLRFEGHQGHVNSAVFSPDGRFVLSGSSDKTVRLWDTATRQELRCFKGHTRWVRSVAFSPDGHLAVSGAYDMTVRLWDAQTGQQLHSYEGHINQVRCVAFTPDGRHVLSASKDRTVRVWDVQAGRGTKERLVFCCDDPCRDPVWCVAVSPDGNFALSNGANNSLTLWDLASGSEVRAFKGHTQSVWAVAFSALGRFALSASSDKTVRLWEVENGREMTCFKGHTSSVWGVGFSPDGKLAVSGGFDHTVRVWDVATGKEVQCLKGHSGEVLSVTFSPDGRHVLSASRDKTIGFWAV